MPKVWWVLSHGFCSIFHMLSSSVKFWKSVKIWQSCREFRGRNFFETQCSVLGYAYVSSAVCKELINLMGQWYLLLGPDHCRVTGCHFFDDSSAEVSRIPTITIAIVMYCPVTGQRDFEVSANGPGRPISYMSKNSYMFLLLVCFPSWKSMPDQYSHQHSGVAIQVALGAYASPVCKLHNIFGMRFLRIMYVWGFTRKTYRYVCKVIQARVV